MLFLRELEVEGFGPFADKQRMEFPENGVVAVYGENMRGKTSLLNAIRYAFFSSVLGRGSRQTKLHTISNRERASRGVFGFSVDLKFSHGGVDYDLVRECKPRSGVGHPAQDADYAEDEYLLKGDEPLGPDERKRTLAHVFPDEISRFFLFDGELLQEYEVLLHDQSEAARKISQSIERILGLPILKKSRTHMGILRDEADKAAAKEASRSEETVATGNALRAAVELRDEQQKELVRLRDDLARLHDEKRAAEDFLRTNARYHTILAERDQCETDLGKAENELTKARGELKDAMKNAWRTLLAPRVRQARERAQVAAARELEVVVARLRKQSLDSGVCVTCERPLEESSSARMMSQLGDGSLDGENDVQTDLQRLAILNRFNDQDVGPLVSTLSRSVDNLTVRRTELVDKLKDLTTELEDANVERMRTSASSLGDIAKKIAVTEEGIEKTQRKIGEIENSINRLNTKLEGLGTADLRTTQARKALLSDAAEVFDRAVDHYKAQLRQRVEESATDLFLSMTTETSDYAGLVINDNYGLEIRHREGGAETGRSAGAEHVVALALMGALQQNAPLRGPIVMDSPFGRLDPGHTSNVVETLPKMASQMVLLVHGKEVTREQLRRLLGSSLKREYELVRVSARSTRIALVE